MAYAFNGSTTIVFGAQNVFDQTPEENRGARSGVGNRFSQYSPFGFNGSFYYVRLKHNFDTSWGS